MAQSAEGKHQITNLSIVIWDLNNFILEKEELLNQFEFCKLHIGLYTAIIMGFFRQQEERLAIRIISWQYQKWGKPIPEDAELKLQAAKIVDEAHHIARQRGQNVISIMKELIGDLKK